VTTFVLATANPHKAQEMSDVLDSLGVEVLARPAHVGDVEETEDTLEANALLKARALARETGHVAIADDTGLFVEALGGRPGVWSARYAGEGATYEENVDKLLREMAAQTNRRASFRTVIAVASPEGVEVTVEGELAGEITLEPRGANGFGYDPVFAPDDTPGRTLAELDTSEKNSLSHRARALRALVDELAREPRRF
jgi:XTP/dITP diphosphohydrolase